MLRAQNAKRLRQSDQTTDGRKSLWVIETASLLKNTILGQVQVNRRQKRHNISTNISSLIKNSNTMYSKYHYFKYWDPVTCFGTIIFQRSRPD